MRNTIVKTLVKTALERRNGAMGRRISGRTNSMAVTELKTRTCCRFPQARSVCRRGIALFGCSFFFANIPAHRAATYCFRGALWPVGVARAIMRLGVDFGFCLP
jgi:hypothetical protein